MSARARRNSIHIISDHGTMRVVRGDRPERAPSEPEYRGPVVCHPAPPFSAAELVAQLLEDPEYDQMLFERRHGVLY